MKRRDAATVAGDGDRADEARKSDSAAGTRTVRAPSVFGPGEEGESARAFLTAEKARGEVRVGHVKVAERFRDVTKSFRSRLERRRGESGAGRQRAIDVDEEEASAATGANRAAVCC